MVAGGQEAITWTSITFDWEAQGEAWPTGRPAEPMWGVGKDSANPSMPLCTPGKPCPGTLGHPLTVLGCSECQCRGLVQMGGATLLPILGSRGLKVKHPLPTPQICTSHCGITFLSQGSWLLPNGLCNQHRVIPVTVTLSVRNVSSHLLGKVDSFFF